MVGKLNGDQWKPNVSHVNDDKVSTHMMQMNKLSGDVANK